MIVYDLQCAAGHSFEGWFDDRASFEAQKKEQLISCPVCNDSNISKLPSAFSIKSSPKQAMKMPLPDNSQVLGKLINEYLEQNFDDVGCDFSKEALKIHYGVSKQRNIRGTSTREEEKMLEKEGVSFVKFPVPASGDAESQ